MKLKKFKPEEIMVPEVRVTARFDEETYAQFKRSIAEAGQVAPIICVLVNGQPVLVDGLHRLKEALTNKQPLIDVVIMEGDMVDVLTRNIYLDHLRGKTPPSEMVTVIEALTKEYGLDSEKIAERTGLSRDYIEKLQAISQLTPLIRAALDDERIRVGHAYALTRIKDPVTQETVFFQQQMYHWNIKELEVYITDLLNFKPPEAKGPAEPVPPIMVKCAYCGEEHDPRSGDIANPNTCKNCAGILFRAMAQARAEEAEAARQQQAGADQGKR